MTPPPPGVPFQISFGDETLIDLAEQPDYQFPHPIQRGVMPLVAYEHDGTELIGVEPLGTTFAIGEGLLLTAKHVFDPIRADERRPGSTLKIRDNISVRALYVSDEPRADQADVWGFAIPMAAMNVFDECDIAFLSANLPTFTSDNTRPRLNVTPLTVKPPPVGTNVLALGYYNLSANASTRRGRPVVNLEQRVIASRGAVQAHHIPLRDTALVNFPAVESDSPTPHGMSGGPVIRTDTGCVCGVISSALDPEDDMGSWTSQCALLAPAFAMSVHMNIDGVTKTWSLLELAELGIVPTDGSHSNIEITPPGEGTREIRWCG